MLCANNYPRSYVDACRAQIDAQLAAYAALPASPALAAFEPLFFNNMVLVLEASFAHRARGFEKKDGNPLNEVRVLAASILNNAGLMGEEKSIKLVPGKTVLGHAKGDKIALSQADFLRLSAAFFAEIEAKFV